jgi:hypothetical protein
MLLPITACITDQDRATLTFEQIDAKIEAQPLAEIFGRKVTKAELSKAFDLVANRKNWKNPIDVHTVLTGEQVALIRDACLFFGAGEPKFTVKAGTVQWDNGCNPVLGYHVTAPGYYATIGA